MFSSPVCDLAPELQTSEIPEGFMKHPVFMDLHRPDDGSVCAPKHVVEDNGLYELKKVTLAVR
jgi:hypothetical protein